MRALGFLGILGVLALVGCRGPRCVPVETVRTEYREADTTAMYERLARLFESRRELEVRTDSVFDREKETVVLRENGDTARHDRERVIYRATGRERELEREVEQRDSVINELRAQLSETSKSRQVDVVEVERERRWWETVLIWLGGLGLAGLLTVLGWRYLKRRVKKG